MKTVYPSTFKRESWRLARVKLQTVISSLGHHVQKLHLTDCLPLMIGSQLLLVSGVD